MSQSSRYARGTRQAPGGDLEPLSRRALQAAGILSLLLILVVVNSLLDSGSEESPFNPNPVAAAAERTQEAPGMRFRVTATVRTAAGPSATVSGEGAYNGDDNLAEVTYRATANGAPLEFDAVLGEDAWYFRYPRFAAKMPEGKEWVKLQGLTGQKDMSTPGVGNPEEGLQMLSASGTVRRLGRARIGDAKTTRYRVTMTTAEISRSLRAEGKDELAEALEGVSAHVVGPVRSEVFVSPGGVLRRMRTATTVTAGGSTATTVVQMDFFDFGVKPPIAVPDDSRVYDITPQLEEGLNVFGQAS